MREKSVAQYITYAVFELLKTKNLTNITTTEIIQKAGVCRSSFYRNFYLPEDVIRQYGVALFREIDHIIPIPKEGMREHIQSFLTHLLSQRERLTLLENRGLFYLLEEPIMGYCVQQIQRLNMWTNRYQAEFYAGASIHLIRAWIRNGFEESPREITELICELVKWQSVGNAEQISHSTK